jgi:ZIP family zinc transporter
VEEPADALLVVLTWLGALGAGAMAMYLLAVRCVMAAFPVALGLLWLPFLRRASARVIGAVLAFTLGLLAFLLVDTTAEGLELAGGLGVGLNGIGVFALGALGALAVFATVESLGGAGRAARLAGRDRHRPAQPG